MLTLGAVSANNVQTYSQNKQILPVISVKNNQVNKSCTLFAHSYRPAFMGFSPKYIEAKKYLDRYREVNEFLPPRATDLYDFSLNRLNGIQEGIKVFDGLNMKEIAFMMRTITEFGVNRGCHNMCSYCYADARPPVKETVDTINKMSWNDFKLMTDGVLELNKRLGFYATAPDINSARRPYISPFHDADGIEVTLRDNLGIERDFTDISDILYESFGVPVVFDTAGWTPKNKKMQERAVKIAQYYSSPENSAKLYQFNISINPFHALHTRQIILERTGDVEKAAKFKNLYEDRIANAIFTFTPLLHSDKIGFIQRVASSDEKVFDGFRYSDLEKMKKSVSDKVRVLYEKDAEGEQLFVRNRLDTDSNMYEVERLMKGSVSQGITLAERGQDVFGKANRHALETEDRVYIQTRRVKDTKRVKEILFDRYSGILDANGKYYLTTWKSTYPAEIKLNFENSDKLTAPIRPYLQEDTPITRSVINTIE